MSSFATHMGKIQTYRQGIGSGVPTWGDGVVSWWFDSAQPAHIATRRIRWPWPILGCGFLENGVNWPNPLQSGILVLIDWPFSQPTWPWILIGIIPAGVESPGSRRLLHKSPLCIQSPEPSSNRAKVHELKKSSTVTNTLSVFREVGGYDDGTMFDNPPKETLFACVLAYLWLATILFAPFLAEHRHYWSHVAPRNLRFRIVQGVRGRQRPINVSGCEFNIAVLATETWGASQEGHQVRHSPDRVRLVMPCSPGWEGKSGSTTFTVFPFQICADVEVWRVSSECLADSVVLNKAQIMALMGPLGN